MNSKVLNFKKEALDELFKRAGFEGYDQKFVDKFPTDWYLRKDWSINNEKSFIHWFVKRHQKIFKSTKRRADCDAQWFVLSYGWKSKH
jgi:hypothetical protein